MIRSFRVRRIAVRVFDRRGAPSWRPYFSRRYCIAAFGVWRIGVQIMRTMSAAEIEEFNASAVRIPSRAPAR